MTAEKPTPPPNRAPGPRPTSPPPPPTTQELQAQVNASYAATVPNPARELGQVAYLAYCASSGRIPLWPLEPAPIKAAWNAAANAVRQSR